MRLVPKFQVAEETAGSTVITSSIRDPASAPTGEGGPGLVTVPKPVYAGGVMRKKDSLRCGRGRTCTWMLRE